MISSEYFWTAVLTAALGCLLFALIPMINKERVPYGSGEDVYKRQDFMRLKELRKEKGISQVKLAMDLCVNQNTISRYENGEREAGYDMSVSYTHLDVYKRQVPTCTAISPTWVLT